MSTHWFGIKMSLQTLCLSLCSACTPFSADTCWDCNGARGVTDAVRKLLWSPFSAARGRTLFLGTYGETVFKRTRQMTDSLFLSFCAVECGAGPLCLWHTLKLCLENEGWDWFSSGVFMKTFLGSVCVCTPLLWRLLKLCVKQEAGDFFSDVVSLSKNTLFSTVSCTHTFCSDIHWNTVFYGAMCMVAWVYLRLVWKVC